MSLFFEVHIAGELFPGQIRVNGDLLENDMLCGIRWEDPMAYYWYDTNPGNQVGSLPSSESPNEPELSFTGPYNGCGGNYNFPSPLTQNGLAPFGLATTLVVQVASWSDVTFLDSNGFDIPTGSGGPPGFEYLCIESTGFCLDDYFFGLPPSVFDEPEQQEFALMSALIFRKSEFTRSAVRHLRGVQAAIGETGISPTTKKAYRKTLKTARLRLRTAVAFDEKIRCFLEQSTFNNGCATHDNLYSRLLQNSLVGLQLDSIITNRVADRLDQFSGDLQRDVNTHLGLLLKDSERSIASLSDVYNQVEMIRNILLPLKHYR